ncbi:MAG TPA: MBL fold metallo-hydrolase [Candidatus Bathyarchaeia archaeon]|nr:MBL fold metallo-hydrolase [Candidatus Bathyarchaeia archaeon]
MKTRLTFYGGINEIGGNKILLEDGDTRIFLDFGLSFADGDRYFCGYLMPRNVNGAGDYLEFNILPRLHGLYAKGMIRNTSIKYEKPKFDAIFLSHPHIDHVGHLPFIDPDITVYCGECSKTIMDAMQESGRVDLGEHETRTFRTGKRIKVDGLTIEPVHVDHSVPGAYGFIIQTSKGSIIYSGDYRLHGPMAHMTREFAEKAARTDPTVMISEGTRIRPEEEQVIHSENRVKADSNKIVANASSRLVIVAFYGRDIDRFKTFYEIAKENDRQFVIPLKLAHLLSKLKSDPMLKIPDVMKDDIILFYKKRKKSGEFAESDYFMWERPFLAKAVNYDFVHENESKLLFNLDLASFTELIDVRPSKGGHFIHSMSEPFSEEDINVEVMNNWLQHFGLQFHQIHASGHCPSKDLAQIINRVQPKKLIPVHTEYPMLFKKMFKHIDVETPEKGTSYILQ